jgi:hypothetical protein
MTVRTFACQLLIRMAMVGGLLAMGGVTAYSATHWEPRMSHNHNAPAPVAAR